MTTIRLFGNDIKVEEEEEEVKSIMLFGVPIFPNAAALNNNNNNMQQHYDRVEDIMPYLPPPDLPPQSMRSAIEFVQGSGLVYMGWKIVETSDIKPLLSRLLIPAEYYSKLLHHMTQSERQKIVLNEDGGVTVSVMGPNGNLHAMKLTRWKSLRRLVFNRGWNDLVKDNPFNQGDILELWHFRVPDNKPCFAVNIIN